jgi:tape measure domain-containing protein
VQQMISKGTVSSEELRQQLGERLYGAMQIAARSLGITTQAFSDLLERGMIPTGRFLPVSVSSIQSSAGSGETGPSMLRMVDGIAAELGSLALTARGARDNTRGGLARSLPRGICRRPPCVRRGRLAYKPRRVRS